MEETGATNLIRYQPLQVLWRPFMCPHLKNHPIHPFTRQIVPLVCEELLTRSSSKSISLEFVSAIHSPSFNQKNFTGQSFFLSYMYFHRMLFVGLCDPRVNLKISI